MHLQKILWFSLIILLISCAGTDVIVDKNTNNDKNIVPKVDEKDDSDTKNESTKTKIPAVEKETEPPAEDNVKKAAHEEEKKEEEKQAVAEED